MPIDRPSLRRFGAKFVLRLGLVAAGATVASALPQITDAQRAHSAASAERVLAERGLRHGSPQELLQIRTELQMLLTEFYEIEQVYGIRDREGQLLQAPSAPGPSLSMIPGLMESVEALSDAELTLLREVLPSLTELHRSSRELRTIAVADRERWIRQGPAAPGISDSGATGSRISRGTEGSLPNASYGCPSGRPSYAGTFSAITVVQAARGVSQFAGRACDQTVAGFNGALVCIVSDGILIAAESVWARIEHCTGDADSAEILASYQRNEVLFNKSNSILSQSNSILSAVGEITTDVLFSLNFVYTSLRTTQANNRIAIINALNLAFVGLDGGQTNILAAVNGGIVSTADRIGDAESAILYAVQNQGTSGDAIADRLDTIEAALADTVELKRIKLHALQTEDPSLYLVVATQAGVGQVDVTFGLLQGYDANGGNFIDITGALFAPVDTGVYLMNLPASAFPDVFRIKCHRELGPSGPEGDLLGCVYFNHDSLHSGGQ